MASVGRPSGHPKTAGKEFAPTGNEANNLHLDRFQASSGFVFNSVFRNVG